jgi:hypothetical protein
MSMSNMTEGRGWLLVVLCVGLCKAGLVMNSSAQATASKPAHLVLAAQRVDGHIAEFRRARDPEELGRGLAALNAIDVGPEQSESRDFVLGQLCRVFQEVDANLDPNFDLRDPPLLNLAPAEFGGLGYRAGIDPSVIKEPDVRRRYEEAVAKNRKKAEMFAFQVPLARVEKQCTEKFVSLTADRLATRPEGDRQRELTALLRSDLLSASRKVKLRAAILKGCQALREPARH